MVELSVAKQEADDLHRRQGDGGVVNVVAVDAIFPHAERVPKVLLARLFNEIGSHLREHRWPKFPKLIERAGLARNRVEYRIVEQLQLLQGCGALSADDLRGVKRPIRAGIGAGGRNGR